MTAMSPDANPNSQPAGDRDHQPLPPGVRPTARVRVVPTPPSSLGRLTVLKVGGSLLDWPELPERLERLLEDLRRRGDRVVVLVGGAAVADWVRALDRIHRLGESRSHHLAIRALEFTSHVLAALAPRLGLDVIDNLDDCDESWLAGRVPILSPRLLLDQDERESPVPLEHSWDVTTDSIAARVAFRLKAELWLLKSTDLPEGVDRFEAACLGLVDPAFPMVAQPLETVVYLNLRAPKLDVQFL